MENKEIPTLEQKQAFWAEQLPNFESIYWLPDHFDFLVFDMEQGNYIIQDDLDPSFEDDATEIWHRVNTGWAMWKKAIKFTEQKATPEGFVLMPSGVLDLTRFMCETWTEIDKFVYKNCQNLELYPLIQGSKTQSAIRKIGKQKFNPFAVGAGIQAMIEAQEQSHD